MQSEPLSPTESVTPYKLLGFSKLKKNALRLIEEDKKLKEEQGKVVGAERQRQFENLIGLMKDLQKSYDLSPKQRAEILTGALLLLKAEIKKSYESNILYRTFANVENSFFYSNVENKILKVSDTNKLDPDSADYVIKAYEAYQAKIAERQKFVQESILPHLQSQREKLRPVAPNKDRQQFVQEKILPNLQSQREKLKPLDPDAKFKEEVNRLNNISLDEKNPIVGQTKEALYAQSMFKLFAPIRDELKTEVRRLHKIRIK